MSREDYHRPDTPYQGLMPYEEEDAAFFFGREGEREIITANLMASRLTLLYGASGVGKSSVLYAGVAHHLRQLARANLNEYGAPEFAVVVLRSWRDDPLVSLTAQVEEAVIRTLDGPALEPAPPTGALAETLGAWAERVGGDLLIILDQFEEYFLYHPDEDGDGTFAVEFPRAVGRPDLRVNFLVSIREDSLAKLDRFKGRIPNLFDNYLRLEHLDREAARAAIEKPIELYNYLQAADGPQVSIEPALVEAVLDQVRTGQVVLGEGGRGTVGGRPTPTAARIETPYLQLVMTRLWDEEMRVGSHALRLDTLNQLGSAEQIVKTHLDAALGALPPNEQDVAARVFHHLVTPSGTKIAHTVPDLAGYAELRQTQLIPVLEQLSGAGIRILRPVAPPPARPAAPRYEIFHDVLAPAVLDWRARLVHAQERDRERRQWRVRLLRGVIGVLLLFSIVVGAYALWEDNRPWAYMRNLSTGTVHTLKDDLVSVGRSTADIHNQIDLRPQTISRRHLLVTQGLLATDERSTNGTTVNAEFLPYGSSRKLRNGDIIVLAGIAPLQLHAIEYSLLQFWTPRMEDFSPPSGWGMLVDGRTRTVNYLVAAQYSLYLDDQNRIILREGETEDVLLSIRRYEDGMVTIKDQDDSVELLVTVKDGDYSYPRKKVPPGTEFPHAPLPFSYKQVPFQIVLIESKLEP